MSIPDLNMIEDRLRAIETSYQRQLALANKPGYDPRLTVQLKSDLDWLMEQKRNFSEGQSEINHKRI